MMDPHEPRGRAPVWTDPPDPGPAPAYEILEVRETPVRVCVVCQHVAGLMVHYDGRRTVPCTLEPDGTGQCASCDRASGRYWRGWLLVAVHGAVSTPRLLALTPHAVAGCPLIRTMQGRLYGTCWVLRRRTHSIVSALFAWPDEHPWKAGVRVLDAHPVVANLYAGRSKPAPIPPPAPPPDINDVPLP